MEAMQDVMKRLPLSTESACSPYAPGTLEQMKADTANATEGNLNLRTAIIALYAGIKAISCRQWR